MKSKKLFYVMMYIYISIFSFAQDELITVTGTVLNKNYKLGETKICFYNSENVSRCIKSNIDGSFSILIPKNRYRVTAEKKNYTSLLGDNFFVDYKYNEVKPLIINMMNNKINIYGSVVNQNGKTLSNVDLKIKMGSELKEIKTNKNGEFKFLGHNGLISIFAQKKGYYGNGVSLLVEDEKFINNILISLETKTFYIAGLLIKNNNYLKKVKLELINAKNNKIISSVATTKDGSFEFRDVLFYEKVYLKVSSVNYKSNVFSIKKDMKNLNIFIN